MIHMAHRSLTDRVRGDAVVLLGVNLQRSAWLATQLGQKLWVWNLPCSPELAFLCTHRDVSLLSGYLRSPSPFYLTVGMVARTVCSKGSFVQLSQMGLP